VVGLVQRDLPNAARLAADLLAQDDPGTAVAVLLPAFLQKQGGVAALAPLLADHPPAREAARIGLRLLSSSGKESAPLSSALTRAAGMTNVPARLDPTTLSRLVREVREHGDARQGAEVFRRPELGCLACHSLGGQGGAIGPDLSAVGTAQPIDFIIGAILEPQKEIKEGFTATYVTMKDGEEYQGYPVRESTDELILKDILRQREVHLRKAELQSRKQGGSLMPSGLADALSPGEFRDLVRFLSDQGRPR
jgi:putative heme-binding domain-containing protein